MTMGNCFGLIEIRKRSLIQTFELIGETAIDKGQEILAAMGHVVTLGYFNCSVVIGNGLVILAYFGIYNPSVVICKQRPRVDLQCFAEIGNGLLTLALAGIRRPAILVEQRMLCGRYLVRFGYFYRLVVVGDGPVVLAVTMIGTPSSVVITSRHTSVSAKATSSVLNGAPAHAEQYEHDKIQRM